MSQESERGQSGKQTHPKCDALPILGVLQRHAAPAILLAQRIAHHCETEEGVERWNQHRLGLEILAGNGWRGTRINCKKQALIYR